MKKLALILGVAFSLALLSSCEHCSSCTYTYRMNGIDSVKVFPKECGNKKTINDYQKMVKTEAVKVGAITTCADE